MDRYASWSGNPNAGLVAWTKRERASYHPTRDLTAERLAVYDLLTDAARAEVDRLVLLVLGKIRTPQFGPLSARELIMALILEEWIEI